MPNNDTIECVLLIGALILTISMFIFPVVSQICGAILGVFIAVAIFFNAILPCVRKKLNKS